MAAVCGIAGQTGPFDVEDGRRMLARLVHRGPDDEGDAVVGGSWLGHRRLSIVDLGGGRQPLFAADGDWAMVGNGEIYNFAALYEGLETEPRTRSDNEVVLHLVRERGNQALADLRGMYAVLVAGPDGRFLAARDPVGVKPLYWARRPASETEPAGGLVFASEMASFDQDLLPAVSAFPPGHYWTPEEGLVRFACAVPEIPAGAGPSTAAEADPEDPELLRSVRDSLVTAVQQRMLGDVPIGVFLSGGLDSSLVAAIAADYYRERGETLQTFAIGTEGSPDLLAARVVAEAIGSEHRESTYTGADALRVLPDVVRTIESFDPALVRSAVPNYLLAAFTAQHVKVVLTGEGADELWAGYEHVHVDFTDEDALQQELVRSVLSLHDLNLQRCDRVTMAHGLEARVPFLDLDVIALALAVPSAVKAVTPERREKYLLRKAFSGWLPEEVLWRTKAQFGDGSGAADVMQGFVDAEVTDEDLEREKDQVDPPLRTREELAYFRLFAQHLPGVDVDRTISRFARS